MTPNRILCKDGGFATQLSVHVGEKIDGDPLWSARFNATNENAVVQTHLDFLKAGADIILTNTYQASIQGYMEYLNLTHDGSIELIKNTVKLAHLAREKYLTECNKDRNDLPMIIGSIGPYGAHLHDGSEYDGSYADVVSKDVIIEWHRTRISAVIDAGVDALAIETIPCQIEAEGLVDFLCDEYPNVKFWISLQCKDGTAIAHGESFRDTCLLIWNKLLKRNATKNCLGLGVNCLHPKFVTSLFKSLNDNLPDNKKLPLVVYPNSGEIYEIDIGWTGKEDCIPLENYIPEWIELGAKIIGGCCRTYARDINRINDAIQNISKKDIN